MELKQSFVDDIRALIASARTTVARGVDLVQVHTNFEIGRRIVEHEQRGKGRAAYGKEVLKALSERLTREFGRGFSASNLAYMRSFYLVYQDRAPILQSAIGKLAPTRKSQTVSDQSAIAQFATEQSIAAHRLPPCAFTLSWTHYLFLLGVKNPDERRFYEIEATTPRLERSRTQAPVQHQPLRTPCLEPRQEGHPQARS